MKAEQKKKERCRRGGQSPSIKVMHISVQFFWSENVISVEERTVAPFDLD